MTTSAYGRLPSPQPVVSANENRKPSRRLGDALAFALPLLLPVEVAIGGRLFASEIVLLFALPVLIDVARRRGARRVSPQVILLGTLWLLGQVVTDIYRLTPAIDYSRGWSKIIVLLVNFAALSLLVDGRWRRVSLFALGLACGELLQFHFSPSVYAAAEPWKFGIGAPITLAGVWLAAHPAVYRKMFASGGILGGLAFVNLQQGFRSMAGICFLAALYTVISRRRQEALGAATLARRSLAIIAVSVSGGAIFVTAYQRAASAGLLGQSAAAKYALQHTGRGTLLGGRPEILASTHAIRDAPVIGHGSWAKDPTYAMALKANLEQAGYRGSAQMPETALIPTHSYLLGAWVEAGVLGAVFWLFTIALALIALVRLSHLADHRIPLVAFIAASFLWNVLFSPFGAEQRLMAAYSILTFLLARNVSGSPQQLQPSSRGGSK
jgi:hypothetical protein